MRIDSLGAQESEPAQPLGVTEVSGGWEGVAGQERGVSVREPGETQRPVRGWGRGRSVDVTTRVLLLPLRATISTNEREKQPISDRLTTKAVDELSV